MEKVLENVLQISALLIINCVRKGVFICFCSDKHGPEDGGISHRLKLIGFGKTGQEGGWSPENW
jgi:hypothetical protein